MNIGRTRTLTDVNLKCLVGNCNGTENGLQGIWRLGLATVMVLKMDYRGFGGWVTVCVLFRALVKVV
jgi:hypothetical protein